MSFLTAGKYSEEVSFDVKDQNANVVLQVASGRQSYDGKVAGTFCPLCQQQALQSSGTSEDTSPETDSAEEDE